MLPDIDRGLSPFNVVSSCNALEHVLLQLVADRALDFCVSLQKSTHLVFFCGYAFVR